MSFRGFVEVLSEYEQLQSSLRKTTRNKAVSEANMQSSWFKLFHFLSFQLPYTTIEDLKLILKGQQLSKKWWVVDTRKKNSERALLIYCVGFSCWRLYSTH